MPSHIEVIVNQNSGTASERENLKTRIEKIFKTHNLAAKVFVAESGEDLMKFAEKAAQSDAEIIAAGGGDGTISAVASTIYKTGKTLGILPLGTLNNFSKDLHIPQNLEEAARVIAENHTKRIDVGEVNGQIFINNSSIGLYPQIVKSRETQQEQLGRGKWSAAFWATLKILRQHSFFTVKLQTRSGAISARTPFVFVGNNKYEMNFFNIGRRECLTDGRLSVYFLRESGRRSLFALVLRLIFGRLRQAKDFQAIDVEEITIETRRKQMLVAFDGEVKTIKTPLCYCVHPLALRVIVPKEVQTEVKD